MSRISFTSKLNEELTITFGLDGSGPYAGYFVQVWGRDEDMPIGDYDTRKHMGAVHTDRMGIVGVLDRHGCPDKYLDRIILDLDPDTKVSIPKMDTEWWIEDL